VPGYALGDLRWYHRETALGIQFTERSETSLLV
jgi:hypothetical protein